MPTVVHVAVTYRRAGTEQVALDLAAGAAADGWRLGFVVPPAPELDGLAAEAEALGARVARIGPLFEAQRHPAVNLWRMFRFFRQTRATVVHLHIPWAPTCFESVVAAWLARAPVRLRTEQNPIVDPLPRKQVVKLKLLDRLVHRIACVSTRNRERHILNGGRRADQITVIPNAITPAPSAGPANRDRAETRSALGLPSEKVLAVMVGALEERKGVLDFVRASAVTSVADLHFVVLGAGPLRVDAERLAGELGVSDRVHFLGSRGDVREILPCFDIYVQPSHYEGLSVAMLEALAAGLPMATTDVDGVSDVFTSGKGALISPVGDISALAANIVLLAEDPELREDLAAISTARVRDDFTTVSMYAAYRVLYMDGRAAAIEPEIAEHVG
jgi:glycosyltransferase involved in cell wall biosynthesis